MLTKLVSHINGLQLTATAACFRKQKLWIQNHVKQCVLQRGSCKHGLNIPEFTSSRHAKQVDILAKDVFAETITSVW